MKLERIGRKGFILFHAALSSSSYRAHGRGRALARRLFLQGYRVHDVLTNGLVLKGLESVEEFAFATRTCQP